MKMSESIGVRRRGTWTHEEDNLLRKCIEKYGEGKWHQVPLKAGLNRCRKSCRLRWLNYLKPDIKRGKFAEDEVDLLIRLHRLLGNRQVWSLIAGRLPGRTANDVKNFWNTTMQKKLASPKEKAMPKDQLSAETTLIKPNARVFSGNLHCSTGKIKPNINVTPLRENTFSLRPPELPPEKDGIQWWNDLCDDKEAGGDGWCIGGSDVGQPQLANTFLPQQKHCDQDPLLDDLNAWSEFSVDMDIWHLLNSDQVLL